MRKYVRVIGLVLIILGHYYFCSYVLSLVHDIKNCDSKIIKENQEIDHKNDFLKEEINSFKTKDEKKKTKINDYMGIIYIPKISLKRYLYDLDSKKNNVDKNIEVLEGSSMPNVAGSNLILAGHNGNTAVGYFRYLYKLSLGDLITINYQGVNYNYKVAKIYDVFKTGKVNIYRDKSKKTLTLITCLGNDKQLVVIGYLNEEIIL